MRVSYDPDAEEELLDAVRFYARTSRALADRFLRAFNQAVATIQEARTTGP